MIPARGRPFGPLRAMAGLLVAVLVASPLLVLGATPYLLGVVLVVTVLFVAGLTRRRSVGAPADRAGSVWSAIPSWQYPGRHVESGGLSRDDQERAIADVRRQAEESEER